MKTLVRTTDVPEEVPPPPAPLPELVKPVVEMSHVPEGVPSAPAPLSESPKPSVEMTEVPEAVPPAPIVQPPGPAPAPGGTPPIGTAPPITATPSPATSLGGGPSSSPSVSSPSSPSTSSPSTSAPSGSSVNPASTGVGRRGLMLPRPAQAVRLRARRHQRHPWRSSSRRTLRWPRRRRLPHHLLPRRSPNRQRQRLRCRVRPVAVVASPVVMPHGASRGRRPRCWCTRRAAADAAGTTANTTARRSSDSRCSAGRTDRAWRGARVDQQYRWCRGRPGAGAGVGGPGRARSDRGGSHGRSFAPPSRRQRSNAVGPPYRCGSQCR